MPFYAFVIFTGLEFCHIEICNQSTLILYCTECILHNTNTECIYSYLSFLDEQVDNIENQLETICVLVAIKGDVADENGTEQPSIWPQQIKTG